jgi:RNA polymerase sigma-B factor
VQSHIKVVRAAQDTFVAQHNELPTFVQLAIHADLNRSELFDALQANQSTHLFSLDDPETHLDIAATQSEYEFVDEWASVRPAIDQLAPLERKILGMRFIEQKRQGEIAQELGMNQMAVSRRLNSILERLRHHVTAV